MKTEQRVIKLTQAEKEMLAILKKHVAINTAPPGRNHMILLSLVRKGYALQGKYFTNTFRVNKSSIH